MHHWINSRAVTTCQLTFVARLHDPGSLPKVHLRNALGFHSKGKGQDLCGHHICCMSFQSFSGIWHNGNDKQSIHFCVSGSHICLLSILVCHFVRRLQCILQPCQQQNDMFHSHPDFMCPAGWQVTARSVCHGSCSMQNMVPTPARS